jgi:hypothetical protein
MKDHEGNQISPEDLQKARDHVAEWKRNNALEILNSNDYASHVTEEQKQSIYNESLKLADSIQRGERDGEFWCWQRLNYFLTGESVALLP